MKKNISNNRTLQWLSNLPVGGTWGRELQYQVQRNLRWLWFDGLFASASDNIILSFISLYILALGATDVQIGLMSSFSSLAAAIMLIGGAFLTEKIGHPKEISLFSGGGFGRLALLMLVFVPIFFHEANVVWIAIGLSVARDAFGNFGFPPWMSVINEVVPIEGRGRFFGSRNFVMGIAGMATTLLAGKLITMFVEYQGYQIALGIAFVFGMFSTYCFAHLKVFPFRPKAIKISGLTFHSITEMVKNQPKFLALVLTAAMWNFSINIAGPFFNVYMVQNLHFTAANVGFLAVISALSGLLVLNRIGTLSDRLGSRQMQFVSMCIIPVLPLAWVLVSQVWHVVIINAIGGALWGAFNLSSFNLLLESIPKNQVSRYSAFYQIVVTLSLAAGALLGSIFISHLGFITIFVASAVGRIIATGFFAKMVHQPQKLEVLSE